MALTKPCRLGADLTEQGRLGERQEADGMSPEAEWNRSPGGPEIRSGRILAQAPLLGINVNEETSYHPT